MELRIDIEEARNLLEITKESTPEEIKKAYRSKVIQYHPDKTGNQKDYQKFIQITQAYETLKKTNSQLSNFGLEDIFNTSNPEIIMRKIFEIIKKSKPIRIDSLVGTLSEENYSRSREIYIANKNEAKREIENVKKILQENFSKDKFMGPNLETRLQELEFYSKELNFNYKNSLEEIHETVLKQVEAKILKEQNVDLMNVKEFDTYLNSKFDFLDNIPLNTESIEGKFQKQIITNTISKVHRYDVKKAKETIQKINLLDEYFSPEDNPHKLLEESYETFLKPFRGTTITGRNKSYMYSILSEYNLKGITQARKARKWIQLVGRI